MSGIQWLTQTCRCGFKSHCHQPSWEVGIGILLFLSIVSGFLKLPAYILYIWFKYNLGQQYYAPQVQLERGLNSWPPDHDGTFHVTETPYALYCPQRDEVVHACVLIPKGSNGRLNVNLDMRPCSYICLYKWILIKKVWSFQCHLTCVCFNP